ncbi:MAG: redox-sensing transcriptional repressor Rex, partial [Clostridia bacterium]|nr:redox-sensing transcriptional repressor Rex [Clostridia bacterium]
GRLPHYLQHLRTVFKNNDEYISATSIAKSLALGEVQVRKDLNSVSGAGKPKIGYEVEELIKSIEKVLGYDNLTNAVLVGAGQLGKALLNYEGFEEFGVRIMAGFDIEAKKQTSNQKQILPMEEFSKFCKENNIKIGIISVNKESSQQICDLMIENGISAIWNFSPLRLNVPEGILLQQENLALSLAHLNNQLVNQN